MVMVKVLFVCMGNICRSPTAEGVFRKLVMEAGREQDFLIDSAGTHDYHAGQAPDTRSVAAARARGIDISGLRARLVQADDFEFFDYLLAMDSNNLASMRSVCAPQQQAKPRLFLDFAEELSEREVPDPYYGGDQGFLRVLNLVEIASVGFLRYLQRAQN